MNIYPPVFDVLFSARMKWECTTDITHIDQLILISATLRSALWKQPAPPYPWQRWSGQVTPAARSRSRSRSWAGRWGVETTVGVGSRGGDRWSVVCLTCSRPAYTVWCCGRWNSLCPWIGWHRCLSGGVWFFWKIVLHCLLFGVDLGTILCTLFSFDAFWHAFPLTFQ